MRIRYQAISYSDIHDIRHYYVQEGSNKLALRIVQMIRVEITTLLANPKKAPPYEVLPGVRRLIVANGNYLVFHRVTESAIEILHIRRAERTPATASDMA